MSSSLRISKSDIINNVILFFLFIVISNTAKLCFDQNFIFSLFGVLLCICFLKKITFDFFILKIGVYWFSINLVYSLIFYADFNFNRVLGALLLLGIAYMSLKIIGKRFWILFEKWIYILTCISLIIFCFQLIVPTLFESLSSVFGEFIADFYKEARPTAWYCFFYTYSPIIDILYSRNCGFMWEPGALAMVVIVAVIYRWFKYGVKFDKYIIIYFLAVLSTMSTAGYISLILLFVIFMIKERQIMKSLLYVVLLLSLLPFVFQLDFFNDKLNSYILDYQSNIGYDNQRLNAIEYDRFTVFDINLHRVLEYPLGYGVNNIKDNFNNEFVGVNGLASLMRMWGIVGFVFFIYSMFVFLKKIGSERTFIVFLGILALLVMFFSNPIENSLLLYLMVISSCLLNNKITLYE